MANLDNINVITIVEFIYYTLRQTNYKHGKILYIEFFWGKDIYLKNIKIDTVMSVEHYCRILNFLFANFAIQHYYYLAILAHKNVYRIYSRISQEICDIFGENFYNLYASQKIKINIPINFFYFS